MKYEKFVLGLPEEIEGDESFCIKDRFWFFFTDRKDSTPTKT